MKINLKRHLKNSGCRSVGRSPGLGPGGRPFEPGHPDQQKNKNNKPHEMKNNETPQESKELIEMANAYQETGIYEPGEENPGQCSDPEVDEWDNIHGDIFLFI